MYITAINHCIPYNRKYIGNDGYIKNSVLPDNNIFIKASEISFSSNTSAGKPLKKLFNITCPYYGIKMISGAAMHKLEQKLDKCPTVGDVVRVLSKYTAYMQKTEKNMYDRFCEYAKISSEKTLPEYLQELYNDSMIKLKLEEFSILDDVDALSKELSPQTAFALRKKITRCREVILENNQQDTFKRKTLISSLDDIKPNPEEEIIFEKIKDRALYLPTSGSSENAFIVKYASRSHPEIAKRLLRSSVATIEHIKPDSLGGENKLSNFMLASSSANSYRSNLPLIKYIEKFPMIPENCQKYINEIIYSIYTGRLQRCEMYPYQVKKTLAIESGGKIDLDLSNYRFKPVRTYLHSV